MSVPEQIIEKVKTMSPEQSKELLAYLEQLERQEEQEDRLDVQAAKQALTELGENIPWEKVKADLGLK